MNGNDLSTGTIHKLFIQQIHKLSVNSSYLENALNVNLSRGEV